MGSIDRLSNLPPDITDHILQSLPLRDAVCTSILSTHWRFKWALIPQLILDYHFSHSIKYVNEFTNILNFGGHVDDGLLDEGMLEYANIVNNILLCHNAPIYKFVLDLPCWFIKYADISRWICFVSRKLIKELTLSRVNLYDIELPSWMFSCVEFNHLTHLTLVGWCLPCVPMTFRGFRSLISLTWQMGDESDGQANKLGIIVSKCPLLEYLDLLIYEDKSFLNIHAPRLHNLVVSGCLSDIFLEQTKRIKTLTLDVELDNEMDHKWELMEFFTCLPVVEKLIAGNYFWDNYHDEHGRPRQKVSNNIHTKFRELKILALDGVHLDSQRDISYLFYFLNMAPKLQILEIKVVNDEGEPSANGITLVGDCCLDHLKSAEVKLNSGSSHDGSGLQLIRMILSSSPVLKVMNIEATLLDSEKSNVATEVLQYRRASTNAEIILNLAQFNEDGC